MTAAALQLIPNPLRNSFLKKLGLGRYFGSSNFKLIVHERPLHRYCMLCHGRHEPRFLSGTVAIYVTGLQESKAKKSGTADRPEG